MRIFLFIIMVYSSIAGADQWFYKEEIQKDEFHFGDTTIERIVDATKDNQYPEFIIKIYTNNELQALYKGLHFEDIIATNSNKVFVGVSNHGLPGKAVMIFDSEGNLREMVNHKKSLFEYCSWSVTVSREWYAKNNPSLEFEYDEKGEIKTVSARSCKGGRVDILEALVDNNY